MNKRLSRTRNSPKLNLNHTNLNKRPKYALKKQKSKEFGAFEQEGVSKLHLEQAANYESDFSTCGAYTPFSTMSLYSRSTKTTNNRRRDAKLLRKSYNLRSKEESFKGGHLLRSLTFGQKLVNRSPFIDNHSIVMSNVEEVDDQFQKIITFDSELEPCFSQNTQDFSFMSQISISNSIQQKSSKDFSSFKQPLNTGKTTLKRSIPASKIKPKIHKFFLEDKLSKQNAQFPLYLEKDLPFLRHRVIITQQKEVLGKEDDHATDSDTVDGARQLLMKEIKNAIKEQQNGISQLAEDSPDENASEQ